MDVKSLTLRNPIKPYRRKKVSEGETWTPEATQKDKGLRCKGCRKLIPWKKLACQYELDHPIEIIYRLWICECGNVLRRDPMLNMTIRDDHVEMESQVKQDDD